MHTIVMSNLSSPDALEPGVEHVRGFIAAIEPPIEVNPELVSRVIKDGALDPIILMRKREQSPSPFSEVLLIGSTEERTTIYARLFSTAKKGTESQSQYEVFAHRTAQLLGILGIRGHAYDFEAPPLTDTI